MHSWIQNCQKFYQRNRGSIILGFSASRLCRESFSLHLLFSHRKLPLLVTRCVFSLKQSLFDYLSLRVGYTYTCSLFLWSRVLPDQESYLKCDVQPYILWCRGIHLYEKHTGICPIGMAIHQAKMNILFIISTQFISNSILSWRKIKLCS